MEDETIDNNYENEINQASDEHDAEEELENEDDSDDSEERRDFGNDDKETTTTQSKLEVKNQSKGYKGSLAFKHTIKEYLENRALADPLFAETFKKANKNIDDCIIYIINTVQKSGCNGFADAEVFGMAVHYYDEDNIEIGKETSATVVVNHKVELTAEEVEEAKKQARKRAEDEQYKKITKMKVTHKVPEKQIIQQSLF